MAIAVVVYVSMRERAFIRVATTSLQSQNRQNIVKSIPIAPIIFAGDIMLGRNVETLMRQNGADYPFAEVSSSFAAAWGVVANLEGPIVSQHTQTLDGSLKFSFKSETAELLRAHNIKLVTLANNHGHDQGAAGAQETRHLLDIAGVARVGDSANIGADDIARMQYGDMPLAVVGFNATWPSFDAAAAIKLVREAAVDGSFTIVEIHWGDEYKTKANTTQRELAQSFIDAGADMIVGHHPHVVEDLELYNGRPIFYSLGNFIFDQYFSKQTQEGLSLALTRAANTIIVKLQPYRIVRSQPQFMNDDERQHWLDEYADMTTTMPTNMVRRGEIIFAR